MSVDTCEIAIVDHKMLVEMWNYQFWPLAISDNVKLPFLTTSMSVAI